MSTGLKIRLAFPFKSASFHPPPLPPSPIHFGLRIQVPKISEDLKHFCLKSIFSSSGEQGWCSGESTHLPLMWLGFASWNWRHLWVESVVGSCPCSERFFSGYSGFPLSSKTEISKFQFNLDYCQALYHEPLAQETPQAFPMLLTLNLMMMRMMMMRMMMMMMMMIIIIIFSKNNHHHHHH